MLETLGGRDAGHVRTGVSHPTQIGFSHNSVKNSPRFPFKSLLTKFFMPFNFETTGSHKMFSRVLLNYKNSHGFRKEKKNKKEIEKSGEGSPQMGDLAQ